MQTTPFTQEDIIGKIYRDLTRLAGEIAIDRCRNRVLLKIVKERIGVSDDDLNALFRAELEENLEQLCQDITGPILAELEDPVTQPTGCCQQN
jgi:hypothetical protein